MARAENEPPRARSPQCNRWTEPDSACAVRWARRLSTKAAAGDAAGLTPVEELHRPFVCGRIIAKTRVAAVVAAALAGFRSPSHTVTQCLRQSLQGGNSGCLPDPSHGRPLSKTDTCLYLRSTAVALSSDRTVSTGLQSGGSLRSEGWRTRSHSMLCPAYRAATQRGGLALRLLKCGGHSRVQRMTSRRGEGCAHFTKPARSNMDGRPMKLDTGGNGPWRGKVG